MNSHQNTHTPTNTEHDSVEEEEENSMMIKRGPWTQEEDGVLLQLVSHFGISNWVRISNSLKSRTPKQCRERYHQNLKPSLNKTPISDQEGARIEELVLHIGKKWAEIARIIGNGRSDNTIKNWWNGGQNKRKRRQIRQQQQLQKQQLEKQQLQQHVAQHQVAQHQVAQHQVAQVLPLPVGMPLGGQFALQQAHEEQVISRKNSYSYDYVSNNSANASRRSSALFLDHPVAAKDSAGTTLGSAPGSSGNGVGHSMLNPIVNHTGFHSPSYGPSHRGSIVSLTTSISNTSNTSSGAGPTVSTINNNNNINNNTGASSPAGNLTRSISSNSLMKWNFKFNNGGSAAPAQHDEQNALFKQHYHMSGTGTHSQGEHGFAQGRRASSISLLLNASSKQQDSSLYSDDHLKRRLSKQLIPVNTQEVLHHYPQKPQHHLQQQQQQQQQPLPPLQALPQQQHLYSANGGNSSSVPNLQGYTSPPMRNNSWTSVHSPVSNASYPSSTIHYAPPPPPQQLPQQQQLQQGQFAPVASPHMGLKMNYSLSFGQPGPAGGQNASTAASSSSSSSSSSNVNPPQGNTQGNAVVLPPIQNMTAHQAASTPAVSQGPPAPSY